MREIKFRAWDKETGEYIKHAEGYWINDVCFGDMLKSKNFDIEQFTGLKDKNGKEIYEGDIIQYFGANRRVKIKKELGIVVFKADRYGAEFTSIIQNDEHGFGGISLLNDLVVGNVHENADLLEGKNENE